MQDRLVQVEGPKGKLELQVHPLIKVALDAAKKELVVTRPDDERQSKALHGLTRSLLANMVEGVTNGYKKSLEIQGVGYKAELKGKTLVMSVGYANTISVPVPAGVTVQVEGLTSSRDRAGQAVGGPVRQRRAARAQTRAVQGQGRPIRRRSREDQAGQGVCRRRRGEIESAK